MEYTKKEKLIINLCTGLLVIVGLCVIGFFIIKQNPYIIKSVNEIEQEIEVLKQAPEISFIDENNIIDKDNTFILNVSVTDESFEKYTNERSQQQMSVDAYVEFLNDIEGIDNNNQELLFKTIETLPKDFFDTKDYIIYCYPDTKEGKTIDYISSIQLTDKEVIINRTFFTLEDINTTNCENTLNIIFLAINDKNKDLTFSGITMNTSSIENDENNEKFVKLYNTLEWKK